MTDLRAGSPCPRVLPVLLALVVALIVPLTLVGVSPAQSAAGGPQVSLSAVGPRWVGESIPVTGSTWNQGSRVDRLVLQRYSTLKQRWWTVSTKVVDNGSYRFAAQRASSAGTVRLRTVLLRSGRWADAARITVTVKARTCAANPGPTTCPKPTVLHQQRTVDGAANCPRLVVATHREQRTVDWRWDSTSKSWVQAPGAWTVVAGSAGTRPAGAADCVKIVNQVPAGARLPDLRIKDLTKCGAGDSAATGGTCFKIVPSAPFNADFPSLAGRKLLKFGVITLNVGAGPGEVLADRSAADATDWKAYQSFYSSTGTLLGSMVDPGVQFYFAGDGHNHWHVRDFDEYDLLASDGSTVATAEKHGYCMQDNTTYTPLQGIPGVPAQPVYAESTSCGKGLPQALTIIHGLSRGWGDTYPTTLPDQCIDITGVPDGVYTVRVHADAVGAVIETDESNNVAQVQVSISGDTVTVVPGSSTGGLP